MIVIVVWDDGEAERFRVTRVPGGDVERSEDVTGEFDVVLTEVDDGRRGYAVLPREVPS